MSGKPNRGKYWTPTDETVDLSREEREFLTAQIREQLTKYRLTQVWLIRQLSVSERRSRKTLFFFMTLTTSTRWRLSSRRPQSRTAVLF